VWGDFALSLFAKVKDLELLRKIIHEGGALFYIEDENGIINKIAYFSNSRIGIYEGQVPEQFARIIKGGAGFKVRVLEYNDFSGKLRVEQ
jgi:hypothetical protein